MELTARKFRTQIGAVLLAGVMAFSSVSCGKIGPWLNVAIADLPTVVAIASNIATLATLNNPGSSAADVEAVQHIGMVASSALNQIQSLYNAYQASPNDSTKQQIIAAISALETQLPGLLQTAQIKNPTLLTEVTAAVNLILTTAETFLTLIPGQATTVTARRASRGLGAAPKPPSPQDLKAQWSDQVCKGDASCVALLK